jgi:hypothetical protein
LYVLGALLLVLLIFHAGYVAGARHRFPRGGERGPEWGFQAPGFGTVRFPHGFFLPEHGAVGTVQTVSTSSLMIETREGGVQTVLLTGKTMFRNLDGSASSTVLGKGMQVIILGVPDESGQISAEVVRIIPPNFSSPQR